MAIQKTTDSRSANSAPARRSLKSAGLSHSLPVYHQLGSILRQQIKDGVYTQDKAMPSEMQLSADYDVSRVTVRRAFELLEKEGRIVRRHGVGTFVSPSPGSVPVAASRVSGLVENLISMGMDTTAKLLEYKPAIIPPAQVAQALGLQPDDTVLKMVRLRSHRGATLSVSTVYLPHSVSHLAQEHLLDDRPVVRMLEEGGIRPYRAEQTMSAVPADDAVAEWLGIGISMPVIRLRRTIFNDQGHPIQHYVGLYNPDNYEYHMMLTRDNSSERPQWRHIG